MSSEGNRTKNQHYVPQFLLRNFSVDSDGRLHVFDKLIEKPFITSPRNVAAEVGFYDFERAGKQRSAEEFLARMETAVSHVISEIVRRESIGHLTKDDRISLALGRTQISVSEIWSRIRRSPLDQSERWR